MMLTIIRDQWSVICHAVVAVTVRRAVNWRDIVCTLLVRRIPVRSSKLLHPGGRSVGGHSVAAAVVRVSMTFNRQLLVP